MGVLPGGSGRRLSRSLPPEMRARRGAVLTIVRKQLALRVLALRLHLGFLLCVSLIGVVAWIGTLGHEKRVAEYQAVVTRSGDKPDGVSGEWRHSGSAPPQLRAYALAHCPRQRPREVGPWGEGSAALAPLRSAGPRADMQRIASDDSGHLHCWVQAATVRNRALAWG